MALGANRPTPPVSSGGLSGFKLNTDEDVYRLILNIQGMEKTGKNHLAFSAPGDIAIQSFDIGLEGVVQKFNKTKRIFAADYELKAQPGDATEKQVEEEAKKLLVKYTQDYYDALNTASVRTIITDTGTETWELIRLAEWGKLNMNSQHYATINPVFRRLVRAAYDHNKNLIMLHKMKDEWTDRGDGSGKQKKTGKTERAGMKEVGFLVQATLQTWRVDPSEFHATMLDCRQNPEVNGMDFSGDLLTFSQIAQFVFPSSTEDHWK